jgi:hypothetical protein
VLGNHDMDNLSKRQVMSNIENTGIPTGRAYYAFSHSGLRMIVLDANYDGHGRDYDHDTVNWRDANVPGQQVDWLKQELKAAVEPVIVLVHQRLDGDGVTSIRMIKGIHYYTLRAVVEGPGLENNAYAVVDVSPDLNIVVTGYQRAVGLQLPHRSASFQTLHVQ